jgi:hypothetical protein
MAGDELGANPELTGELAIGDNSTNYFSWSTVSEATTPNASVIYESNSKYPEYKPPERNIHPRLYFKYVRHNMSILEFNNFKRRMKYLEKLTDEFAKNGQQALSEDCIKKFIVLTRESAMYACGIKTFVTRETLDKFKERIKVPIKYTDLKNFARVIPLGSTKKIRDCIKRKLFDSYIIVHIDNKDATKETEHERITREKDPICFGRIEHSEKYYFICDWVDELDNLKLETIIKALKLDKTKMRLNKSISKEDLKHGKK